MFTRLNLLRPFTAKVSSPMAKENLEPLEGYWKRALPWYQLYSTHLSLKAYRTISPFLELEKAKKVLEIGGGTGAGAEIIVPQLPPSATYTLTDHIEILLKEARDKHIPNTEIINVLPSELPFSGESFDRFIALATIEELETTKKIIREAYRVLEPGGIIGASVSGKRDSDNYRVLIEKVRHKFDIGSPLRFRSDLKNTGMIKKMFQEVGFRRTFMFYENIQYDSSDVQELKKFLMMEPSFAEQEPAKLKKIENYVEQQLNHLLNVEEAPLGIDFLLIVGFKA